MLFHLNRDGHKDFNEYLISRKEVRSEQNRLSEPSYDKNDNDEFGSEVVGATIRHIQQVTSLIEERLVGLAEIAAMLDKILRQHSIDSAVKLPYAAF